jgi:uncharacterized protein
VRVVIDNNVIVSGVFWGRVPRRVLVAAAARRFETVTSVPLVFELGDVLLGDFGVTPDGLAWVLADLLSYAAVVIPSEQPELLPRDPDDVMVLSCAAACRADCIVTGDRDLLVLREVHDTRIITPREFLDLLSESP